MSYLYQAAQNQSMARKTSWIRIYKSYNHLEALSTALANVKQEPFEQIQPVGLQKIYVKQ